MSPVYVVHNPHEKAMQRALIQYKNPENYELVKEALHLARREDLIGFDAHALIPPRKMAASAHVPHKQKTGSGKPNTGAEKAKDTHQNKNRNGKNRENRERRKEKKMNIAIITGASSGIGKRICQTAYRKGTGAG